MSKTVIYVYSTLTSNMEYRLYREGGADLPELVDSVLIRGGSNLPDKHLITPHGVVTKIDAEKYSWLKDNEIFKLHSNNGYISISEHEIDAEKAASDMEGRDESAPLVAEDLAEDDRPTSDEDAAPAPAPAKRGGSRRA